MPEPDRIDRDEVSVFAVGTIILQSWKRIAYWMLIGVLLVAPWALTRPLLYPATASFVPQGVDAARSGLASLAGQFGVALPTSNQSFTPDFYANLLTSRVLLQRVVRDTFEVAAPGARVSFVDLFEVKGKTTAAREEEGVKLLQKKILSVSVIKITGVVQLSAATRWPAVSRRIITDLVDGVNDYNRTTRQEQAKAERKFVEGRVGVAATELRAAEDALQSFLVNNRQFDRSPQLTFERDRLQRVVTQQQQVYNSLIQSYDEVRIREVRDIPVITLVEPPAAAAQPASRGRLTMLVFGLLLGGIVGAVVAFLSRAMGQRAANGDPDAAEFFATARTMRSALLRPFWRGAKRHS